MRVVAFDLPENETRKIIKLMKKLRLRTGSLDLIIQKRENIFSLRLTLLVNMGTFEL